MPCSSAFIPSSYHTTSFFGAPSLPPNSCPRTNIAKTRYTIKSCLPPPPAGDQPQETLEAVPPPPTYQSSTHQSSTHQSSTHQRRRSRSSVSTSFKPDDTNNHFSDTDIGDVQLSNKNAPVSASSSSPKNGKLDMTPSLSKFSSNRSTLTSTPPETNSTSSSPQAESNGNTTSSNEASQPSTTKQTLVPVNIGPLKFEVPARSLLYLVPFLWGSFAPACRWLFSQHPHQSASVFNSERLLVSALVYMPILISEFQPFFQSKQPEEKNEDGTTTPKNYDFVPKGIEIGFWMFITNITQVLGLQLISASRAAFLAQLQAVFVPVIGAILGYDSIKWVTGISSILSITGVLILSQDKSGASLPSLQGDAFEIASTITFSIYVVRLSQFAKQVNPVPLVATRTATQATLAVVSASLIEIKQACSSQVQSIDEPWTLSTVLIGIAVVLWSGLMSSALAGWAQTKGQQAVPASEAALIFATQPLWAAAIAAIALGESFGPKGVAGGSIVVFATFLPIVVKYFGNKESKNNR